MTPTKQDVKRLKLSEMEEWKRKAARLDEAVEYLNGRMDNERLLVVYRILVGEK